MANRVEIQSGIGEVVPILQTDDGLNMIEHKTLESIMLARKIQCQVSEPCVIALPTGGIEVIYQISMKDEKTGRTAIGIGEANPDNLETVISRKFPAKMAYNRAMDNAMIQILDMPSKTYSSMEIERLQVKHEEQNTPAEPPVYEEAVPEMLAFEIPEERPAFQEVKPKTAAPQEKHPETPAPETVEQTKAKNALLPDDEILLFGGYKGKTFGEAKQDKNFGSFKKYILQNPNMKYPDADRQMQLETLRKIFSTEGAA